MRPSIIVTVNAAAIGVTAFSNVRSFSIRADLILAYAELMAQLVHVGEGAGEFDDPERVAAKALENFIRDRCSCKSLNGTAHLPSCTINDV